MIKVFGQTDTSFLSNGDIVLHPLKAKIHKEDNGAYYLDLECGLEYVDFITEGRIIVANAPSGDQAFRVWNVQKTKSKISCQCQHVFFDTKNLLIEDTFVVNKNCNDALDQLNNATDTVSPFTTLSDIGVVDSFRCVRKSLYEAIQTVLERWGGHLVRDNFSLQIRDSIGQDNGVNIQYRKNLQDITCKEDWSKVVTKLLPTGKDGIKLNAVNPSADVYVYSSRTYPIPYTKTVKFNQDHINPEDYVDSDGEQDEVAYKTALVEDLLEQAQTYVDAYSLPQVNYTLKANMERITDVGDTVAVMDERLGVSLLTNVIAFTYDCILEKYTEVQFGNFKQGLSSLMSTINAGTLDIAKEQSEAVAVVLGQDLQDATDKIMGVLGSSFVIYEGDQILIVDELPKEDARYVIRLNSGGIGFSSTGINGTFNSAWTIDGTLDMQQINVINLTANLIKGGTLKLGSESNTSGILEIYDEQNNLIGLMNKDGLKMFGQDGSYVLLNNQVGFAGYDRNDTKIYWVSADEFHMKKSVVEEEITLCGKMRFIPIQIYSGSTLVNDGIGLVSVGGV